MGPELPLTPLSAAFRLALLCGVAALAYLVFFRLRKALPVRLLGLGMAGSLTVFIVMPGYSDTVAHMVGIGRGVDMVLYLAQLLWAFVTIRIYITQLTMSQQITELTRNLAMAQAAPPSRGAARDDPKANQTENDTAHAE